MDNEIIFYTSPEGKKKVEVVFQDENFWLSQKRMAELFAVEVNTVNYHLKEILKVENYWRIQLFEKFE